MNCGTKLAQILTDNSGVSAIIGTRVFPVVIPQAQVLPVVTYAVIAGGPENPLTDRAPADRERVQIDCWADTHVVAMNLAVAVRAAFEDLPALRAKEMQVYCIGFNGSDYESDTRRYRVSLEYSFWTFR